MNVADANGLLMVVAEFVLWPGQNESKLMQTITICNIKQLFKVRRPKIRFKVRRPKIREWFWKTLTSKACFFSKMPTFCTIFLYYAAEMSEKEYLYCVVHYI